MRPEVWTTDNMSDSSESFKSNSLGAVSSDPETQELWQSSATHTPSKKSQSQITAYGSAFHRGQRVLYGEFLSITR